VNLVNALDVAKERAIKIEEIKSNEKQEFVNLIRVDIVTDKNRLTIFGTLSSNQQPRIVKINNVYVETIPQGYMLYINNNDRPGIVGAVGTILGKNNVNIASITFGREVKGGLVTSVVNVDSEVSEAVIKELEKTQDIVFVKQIKV